jgi:hypothetical protein
MVVFGVWRLSFLDFYFEECEGEGKGKGENRDVIESIDLNILSFW